MWTSGYRSGVWSRVGEEWDLVIVGGGITGAGILGEAVRNGKKAILVEAKDFASGTSSRSTKLVHGGLRYLRQGQFLVTRKSVKERERLMDEGSGLVNSLGFSLAAFPGDKMPRWMYGMGLFVYDAIAWKWAHERQTLDEIKTRIPELEGSDVTGGYHYYDAQTDDVRLTLRVLREAVRQGGVAVNYAPAIDLLRTADGRVAGAVVRDTAPGPNCGKTYEIKAKVVINATGAWADDLRKKIGKESRMRKIRGSHLTFPHSRIPVQEAVSLLHPKDGRAVFAVPWEGVTILGTTDKDHPESLDYEPRCSEEEVDYLLECAARAFPKLELGRDDVMNRWAGVRPVIDTGAEDPSKESREHAIWREDGLLTIAGGKLTTFALIAREALAAAEDEIGELGDRTRVLEENPTEIKWPSQLAPDAQVRLLGRFGAELPDVVRDASLVRPVDGSIVLYAEIAHAARSEGVVHLEDLLLRRARVGLVAKNGGLDAIAEIRKVAQPILGWDDLTWDAEEKAYRKLFADAYAI